MARAGVAAHSSSAEWVQLSDKAGKTCYWNRRTRETAWKPPACIEVVWVESLDEEGVRYYWHKATRVSGLDFPLPPG